MAFMAQIAQYKKNSNPGDNILKISGEINERIPLIREGVIAHFPLDGNALNYQFEVSTPIYVPQLIEDVSFKKSGEGIIIEKFEALGVPFNGKLEYSISSDLFKADGSSLEGTILFWVSSSQDDILLSGDKGFIQALDGTDQEVVHLYKAKSDNKVKLSMGGIDIEETPGSTWEPGEAYFIAITFSESKSNISMHLNGEQIISDTAVAFGDWTQLVFGKSKPATEDNYASNIVLRDVSLYNRVLSDAEIDLMCNQMFQLTADGDLVVSEFVELSEDEYSGSPEMKAQKGTVQIVGTIEEEIVFE